LLSAQDLVDLGLALPLFLGLAIVQLRVAGIDRMETVM
jgi:hypothetical protein